MPLLKDLNCSIELSDSQESLQELGTVYGDGFVETFIPVPKKQRVFAVHLSSRNFIAPGIAMYVFIDGVYQCNRNRQNMKFRKPPDRRSLVDFKVRQKEERQKDGSMIAREWKFEKLDHNSAEDAPDSCSASILENLGCIEVVVLRCAGPRDAKTAADMNLNGTTDYPNDRFDRDPFFGTASNRYGPPPPAPSHHSPYVETVGRHEQARGDQSRYSEPVSPGTRSQRDILAPAFQYGSGPLPPRSRAETHRELMDEVLLNGAARAAPTVDPEMLEKIVADAVKRGVEESRKSTMPSGSRKIKQPYEDGFETSSQVPGAWPASPTRPSNHRSHRSGPSERYNRDNDSNDYASTWEQQSKVRKRHSGRNRAETRDGWDEDPGWDKRSRVDRWGSPDEDREDSWDTEETWSKKQPEGWEEVRQRSKPRTRTVGNSFPPRQASYIAEDNNGWTHIGAPSDSSTSLEQSESTLKPSHSRSQVQSVRTRSARRSSRRERSGSGQEPILAQLIENPQWHPSSVHHARPHSVLVTNAPTMMSASVSHYPVDVRSRKASVYTQHAASIIAPPPTWGCASEKARRISAATTYQPPAPFRTMDKDRRESQQSSNSSSWGVTNKTASKQGSGKGPLRHSSWGKEKNSGKAKSTWGAAVNKATDWDTNEKGDGGWSASNDTDAAMGVWNNDNNDWGQADTKEVAVDGWNADSKKDDWGQNDYSKGEQNDTGGFEEWDVNTNAWGAAQDEKTAWDQPQDTSNGIAFNTDMVTTWPAPATTVVDGKAKEKARPPPPPNRYTSKSLFKHRQLSAPHFTPKPHWQFPPAPPKKTLRPAIEDQPAEHPARMKRIPSVPAEQVYKMPKSSALDKGVEHQVLAGPGTQYGHTVNRPEYTDRLDKPYAVFRFKYRSRSVLRGMFGSECLSKVGVASRSGDEQGLKALSRGELIGRMRALQIKLAEREGAESECTERVARGLTERWVEDHSGELEAKNKSASKEKVAAWNEIGDDWQKKVKW